MFNFFKKKKFFAPPKDELIIYHEYTDYGGYSSRDKSKIFSVSGIFEKFRKTGDIPEKWGVYVKCEYNGVTYPTFDLDTVEYKETFEKLYDGVPYVLYQSSPNHYWGILGTENPNILTDTYWLSCNDFRFVDMAKIHGYFRLRALYEEMKRKPILIKSNGDISENFEEFNNKLQSFINNEALELSIIKYKNPQMMLKFDRKRKLDKINSLSQTTLKFDRKRKLDNINSL